MVMAMFPRFAEQEWDEKKLICNDDICDANKRLGGAAQNVPDKREKLEPGA